MLFIFNQPVIIGKLYSRDHISINLSIFIDGKSITLDDIDANCKFQNNTCEVTSDSGSYKTEGGKYGEYQFYILFDICNVMRYYKFGDKLRCKFAEMQGCNANNYMFWGNI